MQQKKKKSKSKFIFYFLKIWNLTWHILVPHQLHVRLNLFNYFLKSSINALQVAKNAILTIPCRIENFCNANLTRSGFSCSHFPSLHSLNFHYYSVYKMALNLSVDGDDNWFDW